MATAAPPETSSCPACGHTGDVELHRTMFEALRRIPQVWRCAEVDPDDLGNGLGGGNERCGCRDPYHAASAAEAVSG